MTVAGFATVTSFPPNTASFADNATTQDNDLGLCGWVFLRKMLSHQAILGQSSSISSRRISGSSKLSICSFNLGVHHFLDECPVLCFATPRAVGDVCILHGFLNEVQANFDVPL
eukprot:scpid93049/ scgid27507/ 